jgi:hypothetical protein
MFEKEMFEKEMNVPLQQSDITFALLGPHLHCWSQYDIPIARPLSVTESCERTAQNKVRF